MGEFLQFVSVDAGTMLFTWINLIILFLILKKFLFKPITNIISRREEEVGKIYADAEAAKDAAQKSREQYEAKLAEAKEEAGKIVENAYKTAQKRSDELIAEAKRDANSVRKNAERDIERERQKAVEDIRSDISSMAVSIASKVIEREVKEDDHKRIIEQFIDSMGDAI
ncbi:MAG: F0F1 ATP synthase subunit B [Clostridia bacterium]|nr:F0F1 ATP synthase subunit B [Clostridia bacterium]